MIERSSPTGTSLPNGLRLRHASFDDMPGIMALEVAGFEPGIREDESVFLERLRVFPNGFLVIEKSRGELLSYLCSERWGHDETHGTRAFSVGHSAQDRHRVDGQTLYISSMTVTPQARGQGLGRILFSASITAILSSEAGIYRELLMVNESWHSARHIYDASGFVPQLYIPEFFEPEKKPRQGAWILARNTVATRSAST